MVAKLSVNLNAVAMLRNRRDLPWPNIVHMGRIALEAGAHGLTVHPRPDERHTRFSDAPKLRALIDDEFPDREFNIEGYPSEDFIKLVIANEPEQVTLVPDDPGQSTSDHGWDFIGKGDYLRSVVHRLKKTGVRVSLFCDPEANEEQISIAAQTGADRVELYTGPYGAAFDNLDHAKREVNKLATTAALARKYMMKVNAGHDLTVGNLPLLVKSIADLMEVSIGHALTADALEFGFGDAVKRFLAVLR